MIVQRFGKQDLEKAIVQEDRVSILRIVRENPELLKLRDSNGRNVLFYTQRGEIALMLLNLGANANIIDKNGNTPLHLPYDWDTLDNNKKFVKKILEKHPELARIRNKRLKYPWENEPIEILELYVDVLKKGSKAEEGIETLKEFFKKDKFLMEMLVGFLISNPKARTKGELSREFLKFLVPYKNIREALLPKFKKIQGWATKRNRDELYRILLMPEEKASLIDKLLKPPSYPLFKEILSFHPMIDPETSSFKEFKESIPKQLIKKYPQYRELWEHNIKLLELSLWLNGINHGAFEKEIKEIFLAYYKGYYKALRYREFNGPIWWVNNVIEHKDGFLLEFTDDFETLFNIGKSPYYQTCLSHDYPDIEKVALLGVLGVPWVKAFVIRKDKDVWGRRLAMLVKNGIVVQKYYGVKDLKPLLNNFIEAYIKKHRLKIPEEPIFLDVPKFPLFLDTPIEGKIGLIMPHEFINS